jgi:hypothetical protein
MRLCQTLFALTVIEKVAKYLISLNALCQTVLFFHNFNLDAATIQLIEEDAALLQKGHRSEPPIVSSSWWR